MPVTYHQLSLKAPLSDCRDMFMDDVPPFFQLLEQHFDISLFKLSFAGHIEPMFQQMADYTEPICQQIDSVLAQTLTYDTSAIELYVTESPPLTPSSVSSRLITRIILMSPI